MQWPSHYIGLHVASLFASFDKTLITTLNCYNPIELDVASPFAIHSLDDP